MNIEYNIDLMRKYCPWKPSIFIHLLVFHSVVCLTKRSRMKTKSPQLRNVNYIFPLKVSC